MYFIVFLSVISSRYEIIVDTVLRVGVKLLIGKIKL